ncbi:MAG TPA: chaperone modulator CbpM [Gammaproteobacteria bacterium]|nr:chaperone modulator CbpM [Gammaproteobacteria bacterium]
MRVELTEVQWLNARQELPLREFVRRSGLTETDLRYLVEFDVLAPLDPQAPAWSFGADCLPLARTAARLHRDLELDGSGLAVALTLIKRIQELETRVRDLDARLLREFPSV